jgi:hypothetical protein
MKMFNPNRFDRVNDFVAFCEKKPAREFYYWDSARVCACGQFFKDENWMHENRVIAMETGIDLDYIAGGQPRTFGALARRVHKQLETAKGS